MKRMCNKGLCPCRRSLAGRRRNCRYFNARCRALRSRAKASGATAQTYSGKRTKPHRGADDKKLLRVMHDLDSVDTFGGVLKLMFQKNPGFMARLAKSVEAA